MVLGYGSQRRAHALNLGDRAAATDVVLELGITLDGQKLILGVLVTTLHLSEGLAAATSFLDARHFSRRLSIGRIHRWLVPTTATPAINNGMPGTMGNSRPTSPTATKINPAIIRNCFNIR